MAQVREMRAEDVPGVLALWDENCKDVERSLSPGEARNMSRLLRGYVGGDRAGCLVAEEENELVGFATFCVYNHPVSGCLGEVEELYVRPEARGRGIGSRLAREAAKELRRRGASVLRALVNNDSSEVSTRALQFWREQGWEDDMVACSLDNGG